MGTGGDEHYKPAILIFVKLYIHMGDLPQHQLKVGFFSGGVNLLGHVLAALGTVTVAAFIFRGDLNFFHRLLSMQDVSVKQQTL